MAAIHPIAADAEHFNDCSTVISVDDYRAIDSLHRYRPDVVVANACAAELLDEGRLIMDDADVAALHATRPEARIIVSHMDTVPHAALTRQDMDQALRRRGIREAVFMPDDGQSADF